MFTLVVAMDENHVIGKDGWMPWNIPADLQHFKRVTLHKNIIMGRKTFESINKPLPQRKTWVVSSNIHWNYDHPYVEVVRDFKQFLIDKHDDEVEYYVCGGAQIYRAALPYCTKLIISWIKQSYDGDTYFPDIDFSGFEVVQTQNYDDFCVKVYMKR